MIPQISDYILHLDRYLVLLFQAYGAWLYPLVFLMIFAETGFVATPFLPGDSLIFGLGALAASGSLSVPFLFALLSLAAILGDSANYWMGNRLGPAIVKRKRVWFLKREYIERTQEFYRKHGGKTIILARFVPIVRTFAPFMAGVGSMGYGQFISYNVIGGLAWVGLFLSAGYFFGNIPFVKRNFSLVIAAIILVSLAPIALEFLRLRRISKGKRAD